MAGKTCSTEIIMKSIVLIDDDKELCSMLSEYLLAEGVEVNSCYDGDSGLEAALSGHCDLVILDVCLPGASGFEILARLRAASSVPVLMLTGRSSTLDRVVGLEMGADDYLPKPFEPRELLARIRAVIRRADAASTPQVHDKKTYTAGDLVLCTATRSVQVGGAPVSLTGAEFTILQMLLEAQGGLVSREDISEKALNRELAPFDRSIDVHISNLRRKLGRSQEGGNRITTVRGAGYIYTDLKPSHEDLAKESLRMVLD